MNRRQLGIVFGVLAALVAVWMAVRSGGGPSGGDSLDIGDALDPDVTHVSIHVPGDSPVHLQSTDAGWTVDGYLAEDSVMTAMLGWLDTLPPARLVARNPSSHDRLGVADSVASRVEFGTTEGKQLELLLGRSGPEGRFVRMPDQAEVYVVPDSAVIDLDRNVVGWRDLTIATADTAALTRIVIRRGPNDTVVLTKNDPDGWAVDGTAVDTTRIRVFLETIASLEANGFPADSFVFAVDFDRPQATLDLYFGGPPTDPPGVSLWFASIPERSEVLVRRADNATAYALEPLVANVLTAGRTRWVGR